MTDTTRGLTRSGEDALKRRAREALYNLARTGVEFHAADLVKEGELPKEFFRQAPSLFNSAVVAGIIVKVGSRIVDTYSADLEDWVTTGEAHRRRRFNIYKGSPKLLGRSE